MLELKTRINPIVQDIPDFILPPDQGDAFVALPQATKMALNTHKEVHNSTSAQQSLIFNHHNRIKTTY